MKNIFWLFIIYVGVCLVMLFLIFINSKAYAMSGPEFVEKYNPDFVPYYGYFLDVAKEYGFTDYEIGTLTGIMKFEGMFGLTGRAKRCFNYGGLRGSRGFYCYQNQFAGIDAMALNWKKFYSGKGTLKQQLDRWVAPVSKKYLNDVKRTIRLLGAQ